jgi:hypothetical protein
MTKQANHANRIPWIGRLGSLTSTCMELLSHNTRRGGAMMQQHTRSFGISQRNDLKTEARTVLRRRLCLRTFCYLVLLA